MAKEPDRSGEDVFALLSDETRLAILQELADAADGTLTLRSEPMAYSDLMERVGLQDSGNFNYHLDALRGRFVTKAEDGYRIRRAGLEIVRTLRAGNLSETEDLEPTALDKCCPYCGARIEVSIKDDWLFVTCTTCPGLYGEMKSMPDGLFLGYEVSPATREGRGAEELFRVVLFSAQQHAKLGFEGICPECTGPVETEFIVCSNHDTGESRVCRACGRPSPALVRGECTVCRLVQIAPPGYTLWSHDRTRRRLEDAGARVWGSLWKQSVDPITWKSAVEHDEETLVHYWLPAEGDDPLRITVNENLDVRLKK